MSGSIIRKSILCVLFAGLALAIQPMSAMEQNKAQASNGYSWLKAGLGIAIGAVATVYAYYKYEQFKTQKNKKLKQEDTLQDAKNLSSKIKNKRLLDAIKAGNLERVKYWIGLDADVNALDSNGHPILFKARDSLPIFEYLISHPKTNINVADKNTRSLLMFIVEKLHDQANGKFFELVLAHPKLNINLQTKFGVTALTVSLEKNIPVNITRALLEHGADANNMLPDLYARLLQEEEDLNPRLVSLLLHPTPLLKAVDFGEKEKMELLLQYGACISERTLTSKTENAIDILKDYIANRKLDCFCIEQGPDGDLADEYDLLIEEYGLTDDQLNDPDFKSKFLAKKRQELTKYKAMLDCIYVYMLPSKNARRKEIEQALHPHINTDSTWIVNQYLCNENPSEDVG